MNARGIRIPGHYWQVIDGQPPALVLVEEVAVSGQLVMCFHGSPAVEDNFDLVDGEFFGPLVPPDRSDDVGNRR